MTHKNKDMFVFRVLEQSVAREDGLQKGVHKVIRRLVRRSLHIGEFKS